MLKLVIVAIIALGVRSFTASAKFLGDDIRKLEGQNYPFRDVKGHNDRPVIAVFSQPLSDSMSKNLDYAGVKTYLMDNYVQFLESAGARVIPIIYGNPIEGELAKLDQVNGILFPGGSGPIEYLEYGKKFYDRAKQINDNGIYFPVWGTCQGFEQLAMYESDKQYNVLEAFNATHIVVNMTFLGQPSDSKMFAPLQNEARIFEQKPMTFQAHSWGLSPDQFSTDKGLSKAFTPISTSVDSDGKVFVAAFESENYPIYGIQFHPEKTIFSWYPNAHIPHDSTTVYYNRYFADFIVNEAKKNNQTLSGKFADQQQLIMENENLKVVTSYDGLDYVFM